MSFSKGCLETDLDEYRENLLPQSNLDAGKSVWRTSAKPLEAPVASGTLEQAHARSATRIKSISYRFFKRAFDLVACICLLPLVAVSFVVLMSFLIIFAGRPIFYRQERVGQNNKPFTIYKFRTMRTDGVEHLSEWLARYPDAHREWQTNQKLRNDPRVIKGGRFLRQTSLDELPQLLNVLRGEMTLVGPRPIVKAELAKYGSRVDMYLAAVPGLTGLWQVSGRCNVSYEQRVAMDEKYVREWSFIKDLAILVRTPLCVFRREGAC